MPLSLKRWEPSGAKADNEPACGIRDGEVIVTITEPERQHAPIASLLRLLDADIRAGRHLHPLPEELARALLANSIHAVNLDEEIEGDVIL